MASKIALIIAGIITIGMAVIAVLSGSPGLAVLVFVMLAIFILGIVLNVFAAKKIHVEINTVENSNYAGGIEVDVIIRNESRIPVLKGLIKLTARNTNFGFSVDEKESFSVGAKDSKRIQMHINSNYCGKYQIILTDVRCRDVWGFTSVSAVKGKEAYACLFPKRYSIGKVTEAIKQNYEKEKKFAGRKNNNLSDILQYREYQKGDSLKNVNWKLSVKHDQLLVREFDTPIDNQLLIVLDINRGDVEYQNMAYQVFYSVCATYLEYHLSYQICWQDGDRLQYGHVENMDDLLAEMREVLSSQVDADMPVAGIFETQDRKEKYARILYITNALNGALEHRLRTWGNAELLFVDGRQFPNLDLNTEMKRLAV